MVEIVTPNLPVYRDRRLSEFPAPGQDVIGAEGLQALHDNPTAQVARDITLDEAERGRRISRWGGRYEPDSPLLDQKSAQDRIKAEGLEGQLTVPETGIRERSLGLLIENRKENNRRNAIIARSPGGLGLGAAGLGVQLGVSLLDPVNVATAFIPVVGEARYAQMLARATSTLGRVGVRAGVGAVEGAVGTAILQPLALDSSRRYQEEYGFNDALANVAFGGVFGSVVHNIAPAVRGASRLARGQDTTVKTAALSEAIAAHLEDRQPRVSEVLAAIDGASKTGSDFSPPVDGSSRSAVGSSGAPLSAQTARQESLTGVKYSTIAGHSVKGDVFDRAIASGVEAFDRATWYDGSEIPDDLDGSAARKAFRVQNEKAISAFLDAADVEYTRQFADSGSTYFGIKTSDGEAEVILRVADHGNTSSRYAEPDINVSPDTADWRAAVDELQRAVVEKNPRFDPEYPDDDPEWIVSIKRDDLVLGKPSGTLTDALTQIRDDRVSLPADESAVLTEVQRLAKQFDSGSQSGAQLAEIENYASATEELIALERQAGRITPEMDAALKDAAQLVSDAEKRAAGLKQAAFCIGRAI